jgi:hypothetical protein
MTDTQTASWSYGWNVPGYMPDTSEGCETWADARDALVWELERLDCDDSTCSAEDCDDSTCSAEECDHAIALLAGASEGQELDVRCGRYVYFVMRNA